MKTIPIKTNSGFKKTANGRSILSQLVSSHLPVSAPPASAAPAAKAAPASAPRPAAGARPCWPWHLARCRGPFRQRGAGRGGGPSEAARKKDMAVGQNPVPLVNIIIGGKWMCIHPKTVGYAAWLYPKSLCVCGCVRWTVPMLQRFERKRRDPQAQINMEPLGGKRKKLMVQCLHDKAQAWKE